jgi:hypothetical protein
MAVLNLQQIFGASATQDATTLTIHKADLAIVGSATPFIPASANTADSILAAIIAFAETNAPDTAAQTDPTQTVGIGDGYKSIVTVSSVDYLLLPKTINFYSIFSGNFNPNNY